LSNLFQDGWYGVFAPSGTLAPIVNKIHNAFKETLESPAVRERLLTQGVEPASAISPEAFAQFLSDSQIK
jgi:tripartite-type tricarboxylate transporter receptor subunit TctC